MGWWWTGDKPYPKPQMAQPTDAIWPYQAITDLSQGNENGKNNLLDTLVKWLSTGPLYQHPGYVHVFIIANIWHNPDDDCEAHCWRSLHVSDRTTLVLWQETHDWYVLCIIRPVL